ncbi:glycosyltransferase [Geminisphaera colitermitum]|uniref:glycosyltransferase n=1 Tax=Geminisphaera colitermitum TaxID=1148786 RepID=UPI0005BC8DA4|nr:glycosyltransferase [Geminisphaera colitermitum]
MRILLTADPELPVPPGLYGGVQRLVAQWLEELRRRGHTVALAAHAESTAACDRLFPWPGANSQRPRHTLRNACALFRAARAFSPDVVHSSSRLLYTWPLLIARIPVVMTYHRLPGTRQIKVARRLGRRIIFTGVSEFITRSGRRGGGEWRTVFNCVDTRRLTFQPEVPADAPLVFLSRIEADKGAHLAIQMALRAGHPLILAGNHSADANAARYWKDQIEPRIDNHMIRYVGPVDDRQKNALLGSARALLVPTQCEEAFGLVFAEALACGTPAIGSRHGAVPEVIEPGKTGWLASDIEEGVAAIARLSTLSRRACREAAEQRFSLDRTVSDYEVIYRELAPRAS